MYSNGKQIFFDAELLSRSELPTSLRETVKNWMTLAADEKSKQAGIVISSLLERILGVVLSDFGHKKLQRLDQEFLFAERVAIAAGTYENKFYRDHLQHSIRVGLTARAIARALQRSQILDDKHECNDYMCAGLLHDIGIATPNLYKTIRTIDNFFKEFCPAISHVPGDTHWHAENYRQGISLLRLDDLLSSENLARLHRDFNHALIGAIEAVSMFDLSSIDEEWNSRIVRILQAVAFHDTEVEKELVFTREPMAVILVLADEVQEWGRESCPEGLVALHDLAQFCLESAIDIRLDYKSCNVKGFSPLKQIQAKQLAFSRLVLDPNFPDFTMSYLLPPYETLDLYSLLTAYHKLWVLSDENARAFAILPPPDPKFEFPAALGSVDQAMHQLMRSNNISERYLYFSYLTGDALLSPMYFTRIQFIKNEDGRVNLALVDDEEGTVNMVHLFSYRCCQSGTDVRELGLGMAFYLVPVLMHRILRLAMYGTSSQYGRGFEMRPEHEQTEIVASRIHTIARGVLINPKIDRQLALLAGWFTSEFTTDLYYAAITV